MTWDQIVVLVGMLASLCAIAFGVMNAVRAGKKDTHEDALSLARIEGKLDSANRGIEDMRVEVRTHGNQIADHATRLARCEESCKSAHHRIDKLERSDE